VDPKADTLIRFALKVVEARGSVTDGDLIEVREVVAIVALHVFTNYFNRMAETDLDFPKVPDLKPVSVAAH
jgi:hypothetical protein